MRIRLSTPLLLAAFAALAVLAGVEHAGAQVTPGMPNPARTKGNRTTPAKNNYTLSDSANVPYLVFTSNGTAYPKKNSTTLTLSGNLTVTGTCTGCGSSSGGSGNAVGTSGTNPATLGNLKLWLKADVDVYSDTACSAVITSGGQVGCWKDQSGNGRNFLGNATVSTRPRYYYASQASHPEIFYNAGASLERPDSTGLALATYTECVVTRDAPNIAGGNEQVFVIWNNAGGNGTLIGESGDGSGQFTVTRDAPAYPDSGLLAKGFFRNDTPNIHCMTYNDSTKVGNVWVNGALVATNTGAASVNYTGTQPIIGSLQAAAATQNFAGTIDEILVYDSVLGGATLGSAMNYMRARWNIGASYGQTGANSGVQTASAPLAVANANLTIPAATSSVDGYLTHADWTTFNGKAPAGAHGLYGGYDDSAIGSGSHIVNQIVWPASSPAISLQSCTFTIGAAGTGVGSCYIEFLDTTTSGICRTSYTCGTPTSGQVLTQSCSSLAVSPGDTIEILESGAAANTTALGNFICSY